MDKCILCGDSEKKVIFYEYEIPYFKCKKCGHYYSSFEREKDYDGYFKKINLEEAERYFDVAHRKMYYSFVKRFLKKKKGRILDVGGGLGFFIKFLEDNTEWEPFGVEISKEAYDFAIKELKVRNYFLGRLEDQDFKGSFFDIVTMWDVLEHLKEPYEILKKIHFLLKDDGILFIHTPNAIFQILKSKLKKIFYGKKEGVKYLEAKDHLNLYTQKSIRRLLNGCGFNKIVFVHLPPIEAIGGETKFIVLKKMWWYFSVFIHKISFDFLNLDNLFVVAKKND